MFLVYINRSKVKLERFRKFMQIQFFQNTIITNNSSMQIRQVKNPLAPLSCDTVSFGAIKKTSLEGFDLACANMFKAPLDKFSSNEDFNLWAKKELEKFLDFNKYKGPEEIVSIERNKILKEWKNYLRDKSNIYINDPALSLIIFSGIVKDLDNDSANLPPSLNKGVLADTIEQINKNLKADKNYRFNFNKIYQNNLRMYYTQDIDDIKTLDGSVIEGWVKIPSRSHDPKNFNKNVNMLKALSYKSWCTKSTQAEPYLKKGDFYIYYDKGYPKVAIRFIGDKIQEIQGEANNGAISIPHFEVVKEFIDKNGFKGAEAQIERAQRSKENFEKVKFDLKDSIVNKDYKKILEYLGFEVKILEDNTFEISHYDQPDKGFSYNNLGIDEKDLFKHISKVKGSADFSNSEITSLGNLQSIGDNAYFIYSKIANLGSLQSIGGTSDFRFSKITSLENLQSIGGGAYFDFSKIISLGNLQSIGRDASFKNSQITTLSNLKSIGGSVYFNHSQVKNLGDLQSIGGHAIFSHSKITNLGNLESIGGNAYFNNSKVTNLGNLRYIGRDANLKYTKIKALSNVEIGGKIHK